MIVVDAATGQRTILSDFGNAAQGSLGLSLSSVAVFRCRADERAEAASGESGNRSPHRCGDGETVQIFVSDLFAGGSAFGFGVSGALFKVDPNTGHRTLISDFSQGDIQGLLYYGLAVNAKDQIIANLSGLVSPNFEFDHTLVRIDPENDARALITDLLNLDQGAIDPGTIITDLAIEHSGKILIGTANINE